MHKGEPRLVQHVVPAEVSLAELRRVIASMIRQARRATTMATVAGHSTYQVGSIGVIAGLIELRKRIATKPRARLTGGNRLARRQPELKWRAVNEGEDVEIVTPIQTMCGWLLVRAGDGREWFSAQLRRIGQPPSSPTGGSSPSSGADSKQENL